MSPDQCLRFRRAVWKWERTAGYKYPRTLNAWLEKLATDETDVLDIFREAQELRGSKQSFLHMQHHIGEKTA